MADLSNDEANELADEILSRDEFLAAREPGFFQRTVDRVLEAIGDFLADIFGAIFGGAGGAAGRSIAVILLALAVGLLLFAIFKAVRDREAKVENVDEGGPRVVFDEIVEPDELREQLQLHRRSGDWRQAVIAGFRLGIVGLIDARIAREIAGATTGDFASAVEQGRPELLDTYRASAASFERAFYSDLLIDERDLATIDTFLARLDTVSAS